MKLFGNSKKSTKKNSSGAERKAAPEKENYTPASGESKGGLISALARRSIEKAKMAIDDDVHSRRTPEERQRIEEDIERYQRRKVIKRIVIVSVILLLIIAAVVFYKVTVVPPDIDGNDPPATNTTEPNPDATEEPDPENTPVPSKRPLENVRQEGMYTFLVVGNDQGNGNTDTLIVGRLDTVNHKLNFVSIPRDTLVNVDWPVKKVNTIQAFGGDGINSLVEGLSDILGFEVDSYISVNLKGFRALVQAIGGVYFDVPQDMKYYDPTQNLRIDVSEGYQLLTPEQAEGVVRFRSDYAAGDIKRIEVQQDFLMALAKQCLSMKNLASNIDEYAEIFKTYVTTDLTVGNLVWYGQEMLKLSPDAISFSTLPANYNDSVRGLSYCTIYLDRWTAMINSDLNPYVAPVKAENLNVITRDDNGTLYATTGVIAGGMDSFFDVSTLNPPEDETPDESPEPSVEPTEEPVESAEPGVENTDAPVDTQPSVTEPTDVPVSTTEPTEATVEPTPENTSEPEATTEPTPEASEDPWDDPETTTAPSEEPEPTPTTAPTPSPTPENNSEGLGGGSPSDLG